MKPTPNLSRRLGRWIAVAAFSFRLLALFPVLFASHPFAPGSGLTICHAGGDQTLPVSEQQALCPLCTACALVAGAESLAPTAVALAPPKVAALDGVIAQVSPVRAFLMAAGYHARAPPLLTV